MLVYTREIGRGDRRLLPRDDSQTSAFKNIDNDPRGPWQSVAFSVQSENEQKRKDYRYLVTTPSGLVIGPPIGRHWNGLPARFEELRTDNRIWFGPMVTAARG